MRVCVIGVTDDFAAHLARRLKQEGHHVVAIDMQANKSMPATAFCSQFMTLDLREKDNCARAVKDCDWVFSWPCKYADRYRCILLILMTGLKMSDDEHKA